MTAMSMMADHFVNKGKHKNATHPECRMLCSVSEAMEVYENK